MYGIVERLFPATEYSKEHWEDCATIQFNKFYELHRTLDNEPEWFKAPKTLDLSWAAREVIEQDIGYGGRAVSTERLFELWRNFDHELPQAVLSFCMQLNNKHPTRVYFYFS